jgi:hypothetical protein
MMSFHMVFKRQQGKGPVGMLDFENGKPGIADFVPGLSAAQSTRVLPVPALAHIETQPRACNGHAATSTKGFGKHPWFRHQGQSPRCC